MVELRILSGLHRGATLPLDGQPLVIGASEDDDVVLADPGVEDGHATLIPRGDVWVLSAGNGDVCDDLSNRSCAEIPLQPGSFARAGAVWLMVAEQDAEWVDPPPQPLDDPSDDLEFATQPDVMGDGDDNRQPARGSRGRRILAIPIVLATVVSAASYAITSRPEPPAAPALNVNSALQREAPNRLDAPVAPSTAAELTSEQLREAFRNRLAEADLLKRFDLALEDHLWNMRAVLDEEEARRFERILAGFMDQHRIDFPVHAKVGSGLQMLPFKIRQVISGAHASIVTGDGARVYVGDEYQGIRLVAVQGNNLTFAGKRKIEVKW